MPTLRETILSPHQGSDMSQESAAHFLLALKLLEGSVQMWVVPDTTRFERIDADARISTMLDNTQPFTRAIRASAHFRQPWQSRLICARGHFFV